MDLVSVIIPTYNRATVLNRAMDSVKAQDFEAWELIVVDDGSTDQTASVVEAWRQRNPDLRIKYVSSANRGVSHARNLGARIASGNWLAFLDSDDEWLPSKLSDQMELTDDFNIIHGEEIWIRNGQQVPVEKKYRKQRGRIFLQCVDVCAISPSTTLLRQDLFERFQGFREDFPVCEDFDLWLRICAEEKVGLVDNPVIHKFGGHADQLSVKFKAMDYFRAKALLPFLDSESLSPEERLKVAQSIFIRAEILIKGYDRYQNLENKAEVQLWRETALKFLTANQMAHSAAERRPRSESNLVL